MGPTATGTSKADSGRRDSLGGSVKSRGSQQSSYSSLSPLPSPVGVFPAGEEITPVAPAVFKLFLHLTITRNFGIYSVLSFLQCSQAQPERLASTPLFRYIHDADIIPLLQALAQAQEQQYASWRGRFFPISRLVRFKAPWEVEYLPTQVDISLISSEKNGERFEGFDLMLTRVSHSASTALSPLPELNEREEEEEDEISWLAFLMQSQNVHEEEEEGDLGYNDDDDDDNSTVYEDDDDE